MTKEEKIKEAWGGIIDSNIDENGWVDTQILSCEKRGIKFEQCKKRSNMDLVFLNRPLSLKGIEDNNGWIKINSEDDLPKSNIDCFFVVYTPEGYSNSGSTISIGRYIKGKNIMSGQENYFTIDNFFYMRSPRVTHYKEISKPNLPLW